MFMHTMTRRALRRGITFAVIGVSALGAQAPATTPSAQEIFDKYVTAVGGRDSWAKHTSIVSRGNMSAMGQEFSIEIVQARPGRSRVRVTTPMGDSDQGYDGTIGWMVQPGAGATLLEGTALDEARFNSNWSTSTYEPGAFREARVVGQVDFEGAKAWHVSVTTPTGRTADHYFDITSGLKLGESTKQTTPMGEVSATQVYANYRTVGDLRLPFTLTTKMSMGEFAMTLTSIELDKADTKAFEAPAEVQALRKP
jgi:hypothetical protein